MSTDHDYAAIGMAVVEAQGVLELVADKLDTETPLAPDEAFTVYAAVRAAIARLDAVHDLLQLTVDVPAPLVAKAPGAVQ